MLPATVATSSPPSSVPVATDDPPVPGPSSIDSARKRRKVTRTRLGCLTCRKRRKACDMVKPECTACGRLKLECRWPDSTPSREQRQAPSAPVAEASTSRGTSTHASMARVGDSASNTPASTSVDDLAAIFGVGNSHAPGNTGGIASVQPFGTVNAGPSTSSNHAAAMTPPIIAPASNAPAANLGPSPLDNNAWLNGLDLDEAMLQSWAAECLVAPATHSLDPFQSLSDLLGMDRPSPPPPPNQSRSASPLGEPHAPLLHHYERSLSNMVSCTGDTVPSAFQAFTRLAKAQSSSPIGKGLHLGTLAWAGRHMANEGEVKYEALSERLGDEASSIVLEQAQMCKSGTLVLEEPGRLTLLAALLMIIQWKICRGDVWGYEPIVDHTLSVSRDLFTAASPGPAPESMSFSFFENLFYHDVLSARAYIRGPLIPSDILDLYSSRAIDKLNTLTGACLPLFVKMHRIASVTKDRRCRQVWDDESLVDMVQVADEIEQELREEKTRMEMLVRANPHMASHRYLHEAFRIACLLSLHSFVLKTPPACLRIRLLVRQSLSLLEQMHDQSLPGFCSAHWVIFLTALCSTQEDAGVGELSDHERIGRLYDDVSDEFAFRNIPRSRIIAEEVWKRNQQGKIYVDWLDIVQEYEWELWLV